MVVCISQCTTRASVPASQSCADRRHLLAGRPSAWTRRHRRGQLCAVKQDQDSNVAYGQGGAQGRTVREELERRREANRTANKGRDREDLYTDKWDGDQFKGSPVNELTVILAVSVLTPLAGLAFAYFTFGTLWG